MKNNIIILSIVISLISVDTGCSSRPCETNADCIVFIEKLLQSSPRYQDLKKQTTKTNYIIDNENSEYFEVAIGENTLDFFRRSDTLRIYKKDNIIKRLVSDDGTHDEKWVIEYSGQDK